ncbi:MAG: hypothetical protein ACRCX4_06950 [Bacteroidales bacterium]
MAPSYILDEMTFGEIDAILSEVENVNRDQWEQTRLIMWSVLQSQSTKSIKPTDVLPFTWDNKGDNTGDNKVVTQTEVEEFKKRNNII